MTGNTKIQSKDVSIVVQGAIDHTPSTKVPSKTHTQLVLESCRQYYPKAELILSTWENSAIEGLDFDVLVLSKDPGDPSPPGEGKAFNLNRQIVSSIEGTKKSTRKYVIKTRTDVIFTHGKGLDYIFKYPSRDEKYSFTKERIVAINFTSRRCKKDPKKGFFHVCDFVYGGLKEDIQELFNIPLYERDWVSYDPLKECYGGDRTGKNNNRYNPESYIWYKNALKHEDIPYEHKLVFTKDTITSSERSIANNLVILNRFQLGVDSLKFNLPLLSYKKMYRHFDWLAIYNQYSKGNATIFPHYFSDPDIITSALRRALQKNKKALKKILP